MALAQRVIGLVRRSSLQPQTSQEFWSAFNVTGHRRFRDREESLRYFWWRSEQYFDYLEHMPVTGQDGKVVLDYGCGPGHDLVGFVEYSRPSRLIGMDVSAASLREAEDRLALHGAKPELVRISESTVRLPLPDASVDYVHCSGVLHHVPDPVGVLRELRRVLRLVRQHADTCGAVRFVGSSNCHGIEIGANHTGRRTGLLHFRNQLDRPAGRKRRKEIAHRRRIGQPRPQFPLRQNSLRALNLAPLRGNNLIENRRHTLSVAGTLRVP